MKTIEDFEEYKILDLGGVETYDFGPTLIKDNEILDIYVNVPDKFKQYYCKCISHASRSSKRRNPCNNRLFCKNK